MRSVLLAMMQVTAAWCLAQQDVMPAPLAPEEGDTCLTHCEVMPVYPGGEQAMIAHLERMVAYPKEARRQWIEGRVYVSFVVEKDGVVSSVRVFRGVHPLLDEEAVRVVSSLERWTPGMQKGRPVRVSYVLPLTFSLNAKPPKKVLKRRAELGW